MGILGDIGKAASEFPGFQILKAHERLIIVTLCLASLCWLGNKINSTYENYEKGKLTVAEQQLAATKSELAQVTQQVSQISQQVTAAQDAAARDKAASAAIIDALTKQNSALNQDIITRDKQTQIQQNADLNASIPELGKRFVELVPNVNPKDIQVAPDQKSVTIGQDTAQKTVAELELVPQLQADEKDLQAQITNLNTELKSQSVALTAESAVADAQSKLIETQKTNIDLLNTEVKQGNAVCDAKIKVAKAKARGFWFKFGAILGGIAGAVAGHYF